MSAAKLSIGIGGAVVGTLLLAGVILYAIDFGIEATVVDRDCSLLSNSVVEVETKLFSINKDVKMPADKCVAAKENAFVSYHLRTGRVSIWAEEGGACIWDTENGPTGCGG